ncbi:hypothetical protein [Polyangium fumosum]|uniref:Uncharacterized protein n=1 Tax=Polyangium fumosum TaxID=889272 RepID=A0A4U1JD30_9BACT|nr:hypothetical protein [Polyangium fumosum]TKD08375.1 hypothetical protein E8A74_15750 [Polyangium fumosum]
MKTQWILLAALALTPLATGCGSVVTDACDKICDCQDCTEREYDECLVEGDAAQETASIYGCDAEYEELTICVIEEYRCTAGVWAPDPTDLLACVSDANDLGQCRDRGSRL